MPKIGKNIYKRKDGRWEGRYIKDRDGSGKIIYGSVYGRTCTEVKQQLSIHAVNEPLRPKIGIVHGKESIVFSEVANQWLSMTSLKVKASTYAGYLNTLELHILPSLGNQDAEADIG